MNRVNHTSFHFLIVFVLLASCTNSIEPSPEPGRLRLILAHAATDSSIIIGTETLPLSLRDSLEVKTFQGKAYQGDNHWVLYETPTTEWAGEITYNILSRNPSGELNRLTIFDYFLPPGDYSYFEFGVSSSYLLLTHGYVYGGVGIPIEPKPDSSPIETFETGFNIISGEITEISLEMASFQSLARFRDVFQFSPQIEIISIEQGIVF